MPEEVTIEDKNEVIAVFDGWELIKGDPNHKCKFCFAGDEPCAAAVDRFVKGGQTIYHYHLKYHSSWDWIVPVVKKIKSFHFDILNSAPIFEYMKAAGAMNSALVTLDLERLHNGKQRKPKNKSY